MKINQVLSRIKSRNDYLEMRESILGEGITHIEDAEINEFISTVENLGKMIVSEKLDGANMVLGLDEDGKLFTSRGAHKGGGERFRSPKDWITAMGGSNSFAANGFASAHQALFRFQKIIESTLKPEESVECEVLFGTVPNAVAYDGKNYIAFLRVVQGPVERLKDMEQALKGKKTAVLSDLLTTSDGINISRQKQTVEWNITSTQFIDGFDLERVNVSQQLSKLKAYINSPANKFPEYTNVEILTLPLTMVPTEQRDKFKSVREEVSDAVLTQFKLPIKEELLNQLVRRLGPKLGKKADEGGWIEGVVVLDPQTKKQLKIVDKDVFTAINNFNWEVRGAVAGKLKGANQLDPSLMGKYLQDMGKIFGMPNLFVPSQTARYLKKLGGKDPEETLAKLVSQLPKGQELPTYKGPIKKLIRTTITNLDKMLDRYNKEREKKVLKVPAGPVEKTVGYGPDVHNRTLQFFAEARAEIESLNTAIDRAKSVGEVLAILLHNKLRTLK